ncbi:MAG: hypothetical protein E7458_05760 [Ruminococcaceae bacterium]|nr:hypothetical protein [Oscillospiraceae bacterium]
MKRRRNLSWIFWTLCTAVLACELAAAGFFLYRAPFLQQPVWLNHEEIACVWLEEHGGMYPIAEKYIGDAYRIRELCGVMNRIAAPREHKTHDGRYSLMGGSLYIYHFVAHDGSETVVTLDGQTPIAYITRPGKEERVPYAFGMRQINHLESIFREEIETSFWYQE